jgi:AcrR family transcriptional regulator
MANHAPPQRLTPGARAVLDAAGRLFYEQGITAVGVEAIAEEARVTKKTVYDRFRSKAALVRAYLQERDERYRRWVEGRIAGRSGTAAVVAVFDALDDWMQEQGPKGCAFVHAHAELLSEPDHPAHAVIRSEKQWLHDTFRSLAEQADLQGADDLATALLALHEGATVLRSTTDLPEVMPTTRRAAAALLQSADPSTAR